MPTHSQANLTVALICLAIATACTPERSVYTGGPILTMNANDRVVEAIGVEGDRIASVGTRDEVLAWAGSNARVVELDGRTIVPGFIDAHGHFPGEGIYSQVVDLNAPPIGGVENMSQLLALLEERASETAAGDWVLGMSYDDTLLPERRHPTRRDLDAVSTAHPIAITHVSGHLAVVNSMALELVGLDRNSRNPEGGVLRRESDGELSGVLEENAMHFIDEKIHTPSLLGSLEIVREGNQRAISQGVTTVQSGLTPASLVPVFDWATRLGLISPRVVIWPAMGVADAVLDGSTTLPAADGPDLWVGAIKLIADGSIQGYTGYLTEPYHVAPGDDSDFRGYPRIERNELRERVTRYHAAGLQVAVHGNGDASMDDILDAFEYALAQHPREDARPIIIHAQMARPDQLDRMAKLGVIPSFFSLHTFYWGDRHRELFMGPERASRMSPGATALAKGVRFTIHCDAPVVPLEPLRLVWSAVNRETRSGFIVGPDERIDAMQALRAVTIDAAYSMFLDKEVGSLEVGKFADLAILSGSPLDDPARIDELRVLETIRGGETIFSADQP
ncbi:MAG: amidohydrolase [Myxococcota bacterium]|nr:amidohydrolase [Myxococcota bacterium]